jgi:hypothetical protein
LISRKFGPSFIIYPFGFSRERHHLIVSIRQQHTHPTMHFIRSSKYQISYSAHPHLHQAAAAELVNLLGPSPAVYIPSLMLLLSSPITHIKRQKKTSTIIPSSSPINFLHWLNK